MVSLTYLTKSLIELGYDVLGYHKGVLPTLLDSSCGSFFGTAGPDEEIQYIYKVSIHALHITHIGVLKLCRESEIHAIQKLNGRLSMAQFGSRSEKTA